MKITMPAMPAMPAMFAAALLASLPAKSELVSISDNGVYQCRAQHLPL